jgi:hypothetical protein
MDNITGHNDKRELGNKDGWGKDQESSSRTLAAGINAERRIVR